LCLNKSKCANQKHRMSNCSNSTEEEKKTLLDAYKASEGSGGSLNSLINSIQSSAHLKVTIGDNNYVAIADTGATHSPIDRPTVGGIPSSSRSPDCYQEASEAHGSVTGHLRGGEKIANSFQ
jgi:hypothetical protein